METRLLDGKKTANQIMAEVSQEIEEVRTHGLVPGLAVVLVGDDTASRIYVRSKTRTCAELGMHSEQVDLPEETSTEQLLAIVQGLNSQDGIDGILIQLPLPDQIDTERVLSAVDPAKDVDGFHPVNVGRLLAGNPGLAPCTPLGILELLQREGVAIKGAEAVVVGRSNIVGKPVAVLLLHQHATVTLCHSRTRDLPEVCRRADILIAAIGRPAMLTRDYIKDGAVVVDVGINRVDRREEIADLYGSDSSRLDQYDRKGYTLVGDVHPRDPLGVAAAVTPVPGGVGPLTIALLMKNTLRACLQRRGPASQARLSSLRA